MYEPDIFQTTRRFGTILENVDLDPRTRALDLDSDRFTENTRGAYPLDFIGNADETGIAGNPRSVIFLTADAFGVLPPISRLTREQAAYPLGKAFRPKVWPPVRRVDSAYGDRNLVCSCPPVEAFA
jgi:phosphoenolpyruvate carboxykinase (ATP)